MDNPVRRAKRPMESRSSVTVRIVESPPGGESRGWRIQFGDRRALRALIYLALAAVSFVVLSFVATVGLFFSDVLAIFFLAWLLAFLLDPLASWLARSGRSMPRTLAVVVVYLLIAVLLIVI